MESIAKMFDKLLEFLSTTDHGDNRFSAKHAHAALTQLIEGDQRQSTMERFFKYSDELIPSTIQTMDGIHLMEKNLTSGIPIEFLSEAYNRNGMLMVDALIEATSKPDVKTDDQKETEHVPESEYDDILTKLDTPEELRKIASKIDSFDDIAHHYEPEDFVFKLDEHLSREERIKKKITFMRDSAKRLTAKKMALKRLSSAPKIRQKARRQAIDMLKERLAKKPIDQLTTAEKERLEDVINKRKELVNRLANKIAPKIRKLEQKRLASHHIQEDAGPEGKRSNSADKEEDVVLGPNGEEIVRVHSPQAVYDNGGVKDINYISQ